MIGYALVGRTAVALGDPVGPAQDRLASIEAYRVFCQRNDWIYYPDAASLSQVWLAVIKANS